MSKIFGWAGFPIDEIFVTFHDSGDACLDTQEHFKIPIVQVKSLGRLDKWLWAVRIYKSRSQAAEACVAGHVKIDDQRVKPSRNVRVGDIISAYNGHVRRTVKVLAQLDRRVGAKVVPGYMEDLTPLEEYARARQESTRPVLQFPKGLGRPTKKQRRQMEKFI